MWVLIPMGFNEPLTHTCQNPHPYPQVQVYTGVCAGCSGKPQGCLWYSLSTLSLPEQDLKHIFEVMSNAWAELTCDAYSSRILAYHVYCDKMEIPEEKCAPTSQLVMSILELYYC